MLHLGEELLLLSLAHDCGRLPAKGSPVLPALAAAVIAELELMGHLHLADENIVTLADQPADPTLAAVHAYILRSREPQAAREWLRRLPSHMDLAHHLAMQLARKGRVHPGRQTPLGISPARQDAAAAALDANARQRLRGMLKDRCLIDPRARCLVALAHACGLLRTQFDAQEWRTLSSCADSLTAGVTIAAVLQKVVEEETDAAALLLITSVAD